MTEQTESMIDTKEQRFRLIKDGKPIGYVIIDTIYYDGFHGAVYATDLQGEDLDEVPDFDTFDRGFEFGEGDKVKWVFEGDKINIQYKDGDIHSGVVKLEETYFRINNNMGIPDYAILKSITVTGNIYEASHEDEYLKKVKEQQKLFGVANDGRKKHG